MSRKAFSPIILESWSAAEAKLSRTLSRYETCIKVDQHRYSWFLEQPKLGEHICIAIALAGEPRANWCQCRIALNQAMHLFSYWMKGADVGSMPRHILQSLLPEIFQQESEPFRQLLGEMAQWRECSFSSNYQSLRRQLRLQGTVGGYPLDLWVEQGEHALLKHWPMTAPMLPAIPLRVIAWVGGTVLNTMEYRSLETGDLIFFDHNLLADQKVILKINSQCQWLASFQARQVTCLEPFRELPMNADKDQISQTDDMPIVLEFEIGEARIDIRELSQLRPGYLFELNETAIDPVKIYISRRLVGRGELVNVSDKLGVRITHWYSHSPQIESID